MQALVFFSGQESSEVRSSFPVSLCLFFVTVLFLYLICYTVFFQCRDTFFSFLFRSIPPGVLTRLQFILQVKLLSDLPPLLPRSLIHLQIPSWYVRLLCRVSVRSRQPSDPLASQPSSSYSFYFSFSSTQLCITSNSITSPRTCDDIFETKKELTLLPSNVSKSTPHWTSLSTKVSQETEDIVLI